MSILLYYGHLVWHLINYVHPYDLKMTYYEWLKNQGFKPVTPEFYHYGADAHEAWADFLLPKIKSIIDNN